MPGFDRTGPRGEGSKTGRGLGKCNSNKQNSDEEILTDDFPRRQRIKRNRKQSSGFGFGKRMDWCESD